MSDKKKQFLEDLRVLMVKYDASFEVTHFHGYCSVDVGIDNEVIFDSTIINPERVLIELDSM